ncbi:hypothetical protein [Sutterella wadsworthensis]|jgi:hypothetical protein|uniref:hypothetical protein n=1 Tax=Sutterella wadsworthensis TaxID=40545 RepID=UPI00205CEF52|nr:MAG TPA: nucleic-acid-binding protein [Caudoviricetes sp.]
MKITLADWTKYLNFVTNGLDCPICRRQKWETSTTDDLLDEVPVAPDRRMIFMRCGYCGHVHFFDRELVEDRIRWIKANRLS